MRTAESDSNVMKETCPICSLEVSELCVGQTVTKVGETGLATLTIRAAQKGLSYNISTGDIIHKTCYKRVTDGRSISQQEATSSREKHKRTGFNYRTCCLFSL